MPRRTRVILAWAIALGWGAFIWDVGTDGFSMTSTSRFLVPLVAWLVPHLEPAAREFILLGIRKLAHLGEYAVFALLVARAIWFGFGPRVRVVCFAALSAVTALAVADETRQAYSALRTGSAYDVGLDIFGGAIAIAVLYALKRLLGRPLFGPVDPPSTNETSTNLGSEA